MTGYLARRSSGKGGHIQGGPRARKRCLGGTLHRLQSQSFFGAANHASADNAAAMRDLTAVPFSAGLSIL